MDRTIIAVQRAEERDLSEKLYKKLQGLVLLYPPTEDLRKHLNHEMFIKPNPQAFFFVMHYLFCLLDATEFRKRFYWPITDKRSEANFRTSTVEYLKYLNEKHKLNFGDIKSYLVVMPGGKKFILFLLEFVAFVVQELTRQREKSFHGSELDATDLNLKRMRKQNAFFKDYASAYISNVDEHIVQLRDKTQRLNKIFDALAKESDTSRAQLCNDQFIALFEKSNRELFEENFVKKTAWLQRMQEPLIDLKNLVEKFQLKEAEMKYDKGRVRQALQKVCDAVPAENTDKLEVFLHPSVNNLDDVRLEELIGAFNRIQPVLENAFTEVEQTRSGGQLMTAELMALKDEFKRIETQITQFQMSLVSQMKKRSAQRKQLLDYENCSNTLMLKYVCTPPIKLETLTNGSLDNMRLPLLADINAKFATESFGGNISVLPRSARKQTAKDTSIDLNNTMNKSRIIDSMQLLRTIHKGTARSQRKISHNLSISSKSLLSTTWRERQNIFHNDIESEPRTKTDDDKSTMPNILKTDGGMNIANGESEHSDVSADMHGIEQFRSSTSPYTPFNANERTRIARGTHLNEVVSSSSGSGGTKTKVIHSRRLSALLKFQDDSLHIANMSTSPSGRLDPLVAAPTADIIETPKLTLNDVTIQENTVLFEKTNERLTTIQQILELSTEGLQLHEGEIKTIQTKTNEENDQNTINNSMCEQKKSDFLTQMDFVGTADDDDLFNISDTVLKDCIM